MIRKGKKSKVADFVNKINRPKSRKKKTQKKYLLYGILFFVLLLIILTLTFYSTFKNIYRQALLAKEKLLLAQEYVQKEDFSEADANLKESVSSFNSANDSLKKVGFLRYLPIVSHQYTSLETVFTSGLDVVDGLEKILSLVTEILEPLKSDSKINLASISTEQKNEILAKIYNSEGMFVEVNNKVNLANKEISSLSEKGLIGPISEGVKLLKQELPAIKDGIEQGTSFARIIPVIAGYPEMKTYLFLLENNTELRPTGGFIGTYGVLKVKDGEIDSFFTDNIYNLDEKAKHLDIDPPAPLKKYNRVEQWFMRDSNWSPDFPTSAKKALWFYDQEGGPEKNFDGVIAITPTMIESLIGLTGSITVHGIEFTADNFVETLQYQVEKGFYQQNIELSQRKEIIGDLSKILIDRILALPQEKWKELFEILDKDLREKQFLIYLRDSASQNLISDNNWGGEIKSSAGDYFALIDTNLASLKSDPGVKRTLNYYLSESKDGKLLANLQVVYNNEGAFTWKTTRYRTYFRAYVPRGSRLVDIMGTNEPKETVDELGRTYFGSFMVVEPKETKKIMFTYELPDYVKELIAEKKYHLLVQKQAGAANYSLNIRLEFKKKIKGFKPVDNGKKESNNNVTFKTSLSEDKEFSILLR